MPTPMACALINTSPARGSGMGTSRHCITPGGPGLSTWMRFTLIRLAAVAVRLACRRRRRTEEVLHRVPQQLAVLVEAFAVRGVRQNAVLPVAVGQLAKEIEQIVVGRVTVPFAARHHH